MQLTIPLKTLKLMVEAVKEAIPKSLPQEILTNFHLEARNELFTITATDLKLWLIRREDCDTIKQEGAIALNAKRFSDAVRSLAGDEVSIKVAEGVAIIKCGKSKFSLPTIAADNYPLTPKAVDGQSFAIATDILHEGIAATLKTVSTDATKPSVMGVHIQGVDEILEGEDDPTHFLSFISTDGRRGSHFKAVCPLLNSLDVTVPTRTLKEVEHISQAETIVTLINGHIRFDTHSLTIISPTIEHPFPPARAMLPNLRKQTLSGTLKCDRRELILSLKRVNTLSEGDIYSQRVDLKIEGDELKFFSAIGGVGNVEESMLCDVGSGDFRSLFNPKYLLCILDTMKAKYVKLEAYEGAQRCVFITPCDGADHETFLMAIGEVKRNKTTETDDDD